MLQLQQKDTKFIADWKSQGAQGGFPCDECGEIPHDQVFIPVQWAPGSTGAAGYTCCGNKFYDEATVSPDGLAVAHWVKRG